MNPWLIYFHKFSTAFDPKMNKKNKKNKKNKLHQAGGSKPKSKSFFRRSSKQKWNPRNQNTKTKKERRRGFEFIFDIVFTLNEINQKFF